MLGSILTPILLYLCKFAEADLSNLCFKNKGFCEFDGFAYPYTYKWQKWRDDDFVRNPNLHAWYFSPPKLEVRSYGPNTGDDGVVFAKLGSKPSVKPYEYPVLPMQINAMLALLYATQQYADIAQFARMLEKAILEQMKSYNCNVDSMELSLVLWGFSKAMIAMKSPARVVSFDESGRIGIWARKTFLSFDYSRVLILYDIAYFLYGKSSVDRYGEAVKSIVNLLTSGTCKTPTVDLAQMLRNHTLLSKYLTAISPGIDVVFEDPSALKEITFEGCYRYDGVTTLPNHSAISRGNTRFEHLLIMMSAFWRFYYNTRCAKDLGNALDAIRSLIPTNIEEAGQLMTDLHAHLQVRILQYLWEIEIAITAMTDLFVNDGELNLMWYDRAQEEKPSDFLYGLNEERAYRIRMRHYSDKRYAYASPVHSPLIWAVMRPDNCTAVTQAELYFEQILRAIQELRPQGQKYPVLPMSITALKIPTIERKTNTVADPEPAIAIMSNEKKVIIARKRGIIDSVLDMVVSLFTFAQEKRVKEKVYDEKLKELSEAFTQNNVLVNRCPLRPALTMENVDRALACIDQYKIETAKSKPEL